MLLLVSLDVIFLEYAHEHVGVAHSLFGFHGNTFPLQITMPVKCNTIENKYY